MKRLGLIGGIGTLAGVDLVRRMVEQCARDGAHEDSDFPDFVYINVPTLETTSCGSIPIVAQRQIMQSFGELDRLNCEVALILCNTVHFLFDEFGKWFSGDIVNMVEISSKKSRGRVAVLQSRMARDHGLYEKFLIEQRHAFSVIPDAEQDVVDGLIANCMGHQNMDKSSVILHDLLSELCDAKVNTVIIGCTELSMIPVWFHQDGFRIIDAGFLAIQEALRLCR